VGDIEGVGRVSLEVCSGGETALQATKDLGSRVSKMMKIQYFALLAVASFALSGCAKDKEMMVQTTDQTKKRVHTQEELLKTGQSETGAALEKTDAAVRTTRP
jgi:mannose/cellobiose epimerase-like protein (N-acyl-D-glucosamine 2-epimerase family)